MGQLIELPEPTLTLVDRLEVAVLGSRSTSVTVTGARRRIVPLTGGTLQRAEADGELLPGASADWQISCRRHGARRHPLHAADRWRRSALRPITRSPRRRRSARASRRAARTSTRAVHLPHLDPDRDRRPRAGLDNKGVFIGVGGAAARPRDLRDLPGRLRRPVTRPGDPPARRRLCSGRLRHKMKRERRSR